MPPEWAPHAGCWMAWPCRPENWDDIEKARATYVEVARAVARFEPVTMTANAEDAGAARGAPRRRARRRGRRRAQRRLVGARHRADLRRRRARRPGRRGLALQRLRRHLRGVRAARATWPSGSSTCSGRDASPRPSSSRAAPCTSTARAPCSRPPRWCSTRAATPGLERDEAERLLCEYLGAETGHLAQLGARPRQHRRARRQPRLLRRARSRRRARLRRPRRPAVRRRAGEPARGCARRPTPAAARSRWSSCPCRRARSPAAPALAELRQLLRRQRSRRDAGLRRSRATRMARDVVARLFPRRIVVQVPTLELAKADGNVHCVTQQQPVA